MPHWPPNYPSTGQIEKILTLLGNPQQKLPPVIHVTGTNGKGSVIAFLKHIFMEHGLTAHIFTSPHLLQFNEKFIIANQMITDDLIYNLTEEIRGKLHNIINPSFFEYQTALALLAFSKVKADICIIECGMGARNDPTGILTNKLASVITPITLDHQEYLGDSIEAIAAHKAYVMKGAQIAINAPQTNMATTLLTNYSKLVNCEIINHQIDYDFDIANNQLAYIDISREKISYYNLPTIQGDHQITNLAVALSVIKNQSLFKFEDQLINQAITKTCWPGRLENMSHFISDTIPGNSEIWFDGAHNEAGAFALAKWLATQSSDKENLIIYGRSENKNHHQFLQHLNHNNKIIFTVVKNEPLSESKFNFTKFLKNHPQYNIKIFDNLESIFSDHLNKSFPPLRIIICGSLYLYRDLHQISQMRSR